MTPAEHRDLREQLGAYALDQLGESPATALRAHLDGCESCRAELATIAPLAGPLRSVDPARLGVEPRPPGELRERVLAQVRAGNVADVRRRRGRAALTALAGLAAAAVVAAAFLAGGALDPLEADAPPVEPIVLTAAAGVDAEAGVVAHTWGTEIKLVASGLDDGASYAVTFTAGDGSQIPAGTVLGTGERPLTCSLNAALLRPDASRVTLTDTTGVVVLEADLST